MKPFRLLAILLVAFPYPLLADVQYTATYFDTPPGGYNIMPMAMNNLGGVVGYYQLKDSGSTHAFLYSNGISTDLGALGGGSSWALGINDLGQVVGSSNDHAFLYYNGFMTDLTPQAATFTAAYSINNAGQIVGTVNDVTNNPVAAQFSGTTAIPLSAPGMSLIIASNINNAGQVAGAAMIKGQEHAVLGNNGIFQDLGTIGGSDSYSWGLDDLGHVVGDSSDSDGDLHSFLYADGTMHDLHGQTSSARGVNNFDQVVGGYLDHSFLYQNGTFFNLRDLAAPNGAISFGPMAINNHGQIAGVASFDMLGNPQTNRGFLLTPITPPAPRMVSATWYASSGLWSSQTDWSSAPLFPSNNSLSNLAFSVSIDAGTVVLDVDAAITSLSLAPGTTLDLSTHHLVLQTASPADKQSKLAQLKSTINTSFNNPGPLLGLTSSTAALDPLHYSIGLFDNALLNLHFFGTQPVDQNSLLATLAHVGDANDDAVVDIQDQSIITNSWQKPATNWANGDLNLDGFVDIQDLTLVTNNWQQQSTFSLDASSALFPKLSPVPEPLTLPLLVFPLLLLKLSHPARDGHNVRNSVQKFG